jgi:endonuclease/exonuclease/phosphatase family metal-dependent hydrolase
MVLNIRTKNYNIAVVSLYSPPEHKFKNIGNRFIIGGDFNAKHTHWESRLITTKGRELLKAINKYKCEAISTGKPTYWPTGRNKNPDLIDFYITKNISSNYIQIEDSLELGSDHSPIVLTLSESIIRKPCNTMLVNKRAGKASG